MVRDERFEGRILRSDQPRGWANVAIDAIPKITGKITRQYRSILFASFVCCLLSRIVVIKTSIKEKKTSRVLVKMKVSRRVV
jgi:hypothetical protein